MSDERFYKDAIHDLAEENRRLVKRIAFHVKRERALLRTIRKLREEKSK